MSEVPRWHKQASKLWMERDGLRLVIHLPLAKGYVRSSVIDHRCPSHHPDRLIGSGTFEDVGSAKDAAETMAERLVRHAVKPDQVRSTYRCSAAGFQRGAKYHRMEVIHERRLPVGSALAGSAIGGVASIATTWLTQHSQDRSRRHAQSVGRRERLHGDLIDEASRCRTSTP
jgi:hypothetical protein